MQLDVCKRMAAIVNDSSAHEAVTRLELEDDLLRASLSGRVGEVEALARFRSLMTRQDQAHRGVLVPQVETTSGIGRHTIDIAGSGRGGPAVELDGSARLRGFALEDHAGDAYGLKVADHPPESRAQPPRLLYRVAVCVVSSSPRFRRVQVVVPAVPLSQDGNGHNQPADQGTEKYQSRKAGASNHGGAVLTNS